MPTANARRFDEIELAGPLLIWEMGCTPCLQSIGATVGEFVCQEEGNDSLVYLSKSSSVMYNHMQA